MRVTVRDLSRSVDIQKKVLWYRNITTEFLHSNLLVLKFGTMAHLVQWLKFWKIKLPDCWKMHLRLQNQCQNSSLASKRLWCHDTSTRKFRATLFSGLSRNLLKTPHLYKCKTVFELTINIINHDRELLNNFSICTKMVWGNVYVKTDYLSVTIVLSSNDRMTMHKKKHFFSLQ